MTLNLPDRGRADKPAKPYEGYPLFAHATGRWAKKIRGRLHYFGPWADPDGALKKYLDQRDALHAGRKPRPEGGVIIRDVLNHFLETKESLVLSGDLSPRTFADYRAATDKLAAFFDLDRLTPDLTPDDFAQLRAWLAKGRGPVTLADAITRVRVIFKHAYDAGLIDRPVQFGQSFKKPSLRVQRADRRAKGPRMFEARHIRRMLKAATPDLAAMILLGVNCGFGNTDCASLPESAIDFKRGWLDWPRQKNENQRRAKLWPSTISAIRQAIESRPAPRSAEDAPLIFLTPRGGRWAKLKDRPLSARFRKLLRLLGLHRNGLGFYSLRRTFETIAGETLDQAAVDLVMGHVDRQQDMAARYRQRISDARLEAVSEHVHRWLFRVPSAVLRRKRGSATRDTDA